MSEVTIIGIDLAKRVFQLHGAYNDGPSRFVRSFHAGSFSRSWHSNLNA